MRLGSDYWKDRTTKDMKMLMMNNANEMAFFVRILYSPGKWLNPLSLITIPLPITTAYEPNLIIKYFKALLEELNEANKDIADTNSRERAV